MISYELAKELKEAGFPQHETWSGSQFLCQHPLPRNADEASAHVLISDTCELAKVPTLSELIEACGNTFEVLTRVVHPDTLETLHWNAWHFGAEKMMSGVTPEEAVARLWLALNPPSHPVLH